VGLDEEAVQAENFAWIHRANLFKAVTSGQDESNVRVNSNKEFTTSSIPSNSNITSSTPAKNSPG